MAGASLTKFVAKSGAMKFAIDSSFVPQLRDSIGRFMAKIADFTPLWPDIAELFWDEVQKNMAGQGSFVGGWRALSPAYAAWKRANIGNVAAPGILVFSGKMRGSLLLGGVGNVTKLRPTDMILTSRDPKLPYHQRGTAKMPKRPVLFWSRNPEYGRLLRSYVAFRASEAKLPNVDPSSSPRGMR